MRKSHSFCLFGWLFCFCFFVLLACFFRSVSVYIKIYYSFWVIKFPDIHLIWNLSHIWTLSLTLRPAFKSSSNLWLLWVSQDLRGLGNRRKITSMIEMQHWCPLGRVKWIAYCILSQFLQRSPHSWQEVFLSRTCFKILCEVHIWQLENIHLYRVWELAAHPTAAFFSLSIEFFSCSSRESNISPCASKVV